jgi:DNA polymerase-3 subunit gamma/tau
MLGLADKSVQRRLFAALLAGDGTVLLDLVALQFSLGVEPLALLRGVMDLTHRVTVAQIGAKDGQGGLADAASAEEREAIESWAKGMSAGQLHRLWQLLLKGFDEVRTAPDPLVAAQMALLRVMHAADMPDPGQLARRLEDLASRPGPAVSANGASADAAPAALSLPWEALVELVEARQLGLATKMRLQVRVVELAPGKLRYSQPQGFTEDFSREMKAGLEEATGQSWAVERCDAPGQPTLIEQGEAAAAVKQAEMRRSPLMAAVIAAFPGAEEIQEDRDAPRARNERNWSQKR